MKVALTVVGAIAEFGALVLVVWDFYEARRQAERLLSSRAGMPSNVRPEDLSPEERERYRAADLKAQVVYALTPPSREDLRNVESGAQDTRVEVADALHGSMGRKWASIVLLSIGITFAAIANLL